MDAALQRGSRRLGPIANAVSIFLAFDTCVGPELNPGRVIATVILNAEFLSERATSRVGYIQLVLSELGCNPNRGEASLL